MSGGYMRLVDLVSKMDRELLSEYRAVGRQLILLNEILILVACPIKWMQSLSQDYKLVI